ncbi:MAG: RHS repeat protein, partial [Deltaproteobacteria bacterium]|nr:RHS repeat protein [Deltaproteobacteria bacterium]
MNKLLRVIAILGFAAGMGIWSRAAGAETTPRNCLTTVPMTSIWTQTICPNTANQREVEKESTFTLTLPAECPPSTSSGSVVESTSTYSSGGSGSSTQTSGGYPAGSSPTLIAQEECFGPNCTGKVCEINRDCTGSSVLLANGTYEFTETDLKVPSRAVPVEWKRTYRSNRVLYTDSGLVFGEPVDGPLGFGWTNRFFARIEGEDTYVDGEGRYITFEKDASGNFITDAENGLSLKKTSTGFEVKERGGLTNVFDSNGKLKEIKDPSGKSVTLVYGVDGSLTSIKDASYRQALTFSYTDSRITTVTDLGGRSVRYEYDLFGNLTSSIDPAAQARTYTYNTYHGLTSKANPLGETTTIDYLHADKGVTGKVIDPVGTALLLLGQPATGHEKDDLYDFSNKTFYVTDWNGVQVKKTINDSGKLTSETETATGVVLKKIEYLDNRVEVHTDSAGNTTTLQKDEWGNVTKSTDGEGNETATIYNTESMPVSITDPLGTITGFEYDNTGTLLTRLVRASGKPEQAATDITYTAYGEVESRTIDGATTSYTYNEMGLPATVTGPLGNITRLEYDQYGNLTASIDPVDNRSEFVYDILGNLVETKDPLGNRTIQTYNAAGRRVKVKDALLRETNYETDFKGRITAVIDALGNRKEREYDGNGNLKKITEGPAITEFAYDSSDRLSSITDAEGNTTSYEYTTASTACASCGGNSSTPARITDPFGNLTEYSFDKSGKINGITDPLLYMTAIAYDAGGRVSSRTDANGNITNYEYDALGRVKKQINVDSVNKEIVFSYDSRGNLASLTDPSRHTTTFEYDLADRKTKETDPLNEATEYTYYPNNFLKTVRDAKGQTATYNYDAAGRLTSITYADLKQDNFTYDAVGNLLTYANEGVSGTFTYDELNRKLTETVNYGAFSKTYSYTYDDRGNKAAYTSPEGVVYSYTYRLNNQPTGISFNGNTIALNYQLDRLVSSTLPNGITTDYQYN